MFEYYKRAANSNQILGIIYGAEIYRFVCRDKQNDCKAEDVVEHTCLLD